VNSTILEDGRPVRGLTNQAHCQNFAWVGQEGVTDIVAYEEPGECAAVPWFRIYAGEEIVSRVAARHVAVHYVTKEAF
jgi:hypothetical protein